MKAADVYLEVINNLRDGVYFVDVERNITFWNEAAEKISGYAASEVVGRNCKDGILSHIDEEGKPLCVIGCPLIATIMDGEKREHDVFLRHKDGYRIPVHVNIFPMVEDGEIIGGIEVFTQNSPVVYEENLIERLSEIAMNDTLTGLPNRRYINSFLDYRLHEYRRFDTPFALLFMDIDNFGSFNNTYGHDLGDAVLKNISTSIKKNLRNSDLFGRWGGEEFLGVFTVKAFNDAFLLAEKVRVLVANTEIMHKDIHLSVTASIGVTVIRKDDDVDSIVNRADQLMYKGKKSGKNCVVCEQ